MTSTYYHYSVFVEEDGDEEETDEEEVESEGEETENQIDPRDAADDWFVSNTEGEKSGDEEESSEDSEVEDVDNEEADEVEEPTDEPFGEYVVGTKDEDGNRYILALDRIFLDEEDRDTTQEAYYGKVQQKQSVSDQEGEADEELFDLEDKVIDDASEGTTSPPEYRAARMGILYDDDRIHFLIETRPGIPGINKTLEFVKTGIQDSGYTVNKEPKDREFSEDRMSSLLSSDLDEATLSFVRNPGDNKTEKISVDDSVEDAAPGDYRIELHISSGRKDIDTIAVKEVLSDKLGIDEGNLAEKLTDSDVRSEFETLKVSGEKSVEINFTIDQGHDRIDDLGDEFLSEELGKKLIETIKDRIPDEDSDAGSGEEEEEDDE